MDQIQEKKTTKSTIRNMSKKFLLYSIIVSSTKSIWRQPLRNTSMKQVNSKQVWVVGHFLVIFFVWPSGSLIEFEISHLLYI